MAAGDISVFDEAKAYMIDGGWEAADTIKLALLTSATAPTDADTTPALGDYTQVTAGGNYVAGGETLGTLGNCVTETAGTMTFDDTGESVTWAQNGSNPTNARYGLIYNDTDAGDLAIAWLDLGSVVDMSAGDLTITWNASGIFTIA
jgi:hypothetical protein